MKNAGQGIYARWNNKRFQHNFDLKNYKKSNALELPTAR